ncbi:MAG: MurR/RpiR family transcriptional regulator [Finegoldia sp.]|nr:MurR/RpiR family transcriptional regulator [Finegoldia sp.]
MKENPLLKISENYPNFSKKEKLIADAILKKQTDTIYYSIKEFSKISKTSESSIVRFCQSLGFKGFSDLKLEIAKSSYAISKKDEAIFSDELSSKGLFEETLKLLNTYSSGIDYGKIKKIAETIYESKLVLIYGNNETGHMADLFTQQLISRSIPAVLSYNKVDMKKNTNLVNQDSVCIYLSHSGASKTILENAKTTFGKSKANIGITKSPLSPLISYCDLAIIIPFYKTEVLEYYFQTIIAMFIVLNLIAAEIELIAKKTDDTSSIEIRNYVYNSLLE